MCLLGHSLLCSFGTVGTVGNLQCYHNIFELRVSALHPEQALPFKA